MNSDLEGLNLVQLLDRLEPAPEPLPISLMPQTVGWIWLAIGLVFGMLFLLQEVLRHRRANAYRRAALAALSEAGDDPARIAQIIRRTALAAYPREDVAGLTGEHWLAFLDRTLPGDKFSDGPGRVIADAPYTKVPTTTGLADLARHWISSHKSAPRGRRA